jgi:ESCRT-II complex subunit VPS36
MNRSYWCELGQLLPGEKLIHQASEVRIYDGDERTDFEVGTLQLTTHRLLWDDVEQEGHSIAFDLKLTQSTDTVAAGFMRSAKIKVYFISIPPNKPAGPSGKHDYIQLSFRKGGQEQFNSQLSVQLVNRLWEKIPEAVAGGLKLRKGIVGIERNMEKKQRESDYQVSVAFKDLDALIDKAKEMVNVVNKFAAKMEEKKGSITEDETAQFRSYMLSVGISNPVTRDTQVSTSKYHSELSRELADFLQLPLIVTLLLHKYTHCNVILLM